MMKKLAVTTLLALAAVAAMADNPHGMPPGIAKKMAHCANCGQVQDVRHESRKGQGGAVGIVGGAAVGGLLGNQVGHGNGRALATVGGAVAGGFLGNEVQKRATASDVWITHVKMRDGSVRTFEHAAQPAWRPGMVVKVNQNSLSIVAGS